MRILKASQIKINPYIHLITDTRYQGIQKLHSKSALPRKKIKKKILNKTHLKGKNQELEREMMANKDSKWKYIAMLKLFKSYPINNSNRRKKFGLRFNLISAIYHIEILW